MKKIFMLMLLCGLLKGEAQVPFTPGNLVVLRIGDGSTTLSSASARVSLVEYTPGGTLVQAIDVPSTGTDKLTNSGSATSEGALSLSADGRYLSFVGYDALTGVASIAGTSTNKVVARVDAAGNIDLTTKFPNADISANNPRGAVTLDGSSFWVCGGNGGVRYLPYGNTISTNSIQLTTSPTNTRIPQIFNRQLYITSSSGSFCSVATVGTGLPTSGTQTVTVLPGLPITTGTGSPYAFYFFDLSDAVAGYDVVYIADQASTGGAGLRKYSLVSGTWTLNNTITGTGLNGITGLTGCVNASGNVVLYATFGNGANNAIQTLTDAGGYNANNTGTFSSVASAGANYVFRGLAFTPASFTWTGGTNTDWNTAGNWSAAGIPTASASPISIPSGLTNYPDITANTYVSNLNLEAGASIKVTGGSVSLRNVTQPMLLKSNNIASAYIGTSTGTIKGNATVERYIPAKRAFRFLAPSITSTSSIKTNWQEGAASSTANPFAGFGTHITGNAVDGTDGFDGTLTGAASMFTYNGSWNAITNTNATTFTAGTPYRILIRGSRSVDLTNNSSTASVTRLRATGTLYFGNYAPTLSTTLNDYTFIGNPYASPIDWHTVGKVNINSSYFTWDPNMTGTNNRGAYVAYDVSTGFNNLGNAGTSNVNRYIQPGQAFFVQTTGATPSLTIQESDKATNFTAVFRGTNTYANIATLLYKTSEVNSGKAADGTTVVYDDQFSNSFGSGDVVKMINPDENISVVNNNRSLCIEARSNFTEHDTIWLQLSQLNTLDYTLQIRSENFGVATSAVLIDNFNGTTTPLNMNGVTDVSFTVSANPLSAKSDRFYIALRNTAALPVTLINIKAAQKNNGIEVEWTGLNEINISAYEIEKSIDGISFIRKGNISAKNNGANMNSYQWFDGSINKGNNYYRIKAIEKDGTFKYSTVVNAKTGKEGNITIAPTLVTAGIVQVQFENMIKGKYNINVFNNLGQLITTKTINHAGGSITEILNVSNMPKGNYQLQVVNNDQSFTKGFIIN